MLFHSFLELPTVLTLLSEEEKDSDGGVQESCGKRWRMKGLHHRSPVASPPNFLSLDIVAKEEHLKLKVDVIIKHRNIVRTEAYHKE